MTILDHRDELQIIHETNSFLKCICPVCGGSNLKISLASNSYGAYKCWSNYCEPAEIRKKLGIIETENYQLCPYKIEIPRSTYASNIDRKIHNTKPKLVNNYSLVKLKDYKAISSTTRTFADGSKKKTTIYPYSNTQRVYRLDSYDPQSPKQIYLQWLDPTTQNWELGIGNQTWSVYTRGIEGASTGNASLWVEGEKSAEYAKECGLLAVTNASHTFNYSYLYKIYMGFFLKFPQISNLVVIPDEDEPGYHKAEMILKTCWYLGKGAKLLTLNELNPSFSFEPNSGVDIVDAKLNSKFILNT